MKKTIEGFSIDWNDQIHCNLHYEQFSEILDVIQGHEDQEFPLSWFKSMIPAISGWDDLTLEQNIFLLKKLQVIDFEATNHTLKLFKFRSIPTNVKHFKRLTNNRIKPDFKLSKDEYFALLCEIEREVQQEEYLKAKQHFIDEIVSRYTRSEKVQKLIAERDRRNEEYKSVYNVFMDYNVENKEKLAEKLFEMNSHYHTFPTHPNFSFFFPTPFEQLKKGLYERFWMLLKIRILNELIEAEAQSHAPPQGDNPEPPPFKNVFNSIQDYDEIRQKFVELTQFKSKGNNEPVLTEDQLEEFLQAAFIHGKIDKKIKMNYATKEKSKVIAIFHGFYLYCKDDYELSRSTLEKYRELLSKYFLGFDNGFNFRS